MGAEYFLIALLTNLEAETNPFDAERLFDAIVSRFPDSATEHRAIGIALASRSPLLVWRAALRAGPASHAALTPVVRELTIELLWREPPEIAAALARTLGHIGDPETESELISLLEHPSTLVRIAAAEALVSVGSVAAVPALLEASRGFLFANDLRRALKNAIVEIQARTVCAEKGSLSLLGGSFGRQGALSLGHSAGALSLPQHPDA